MEVPAEVLIHNDLMGVKGGKGTLIRIAAEGFYEVNFHFGDKLHRVLFPIARTVLIAAQPEEAFSNQVEVER